MKNKRMERSAVQIAADGLEMIARFSSAEMDALQSELLERCEQKKKSPRTDSWALAQRAFIKLQPMLDDYGAKSMKHITSRSVERELLELVRDVAEAGDDVLPYFARIDAALVGLRRLRRSVDYLQDNRAKQKTTSASPDDARHTSTLGALVRELMADGLAVPTEIFSVFDKAEDVVPRTDMSGTVTGSNSSPPKSRRRDRRNP